MKEFLIITKDKTYKIYCDDFYKAVEESYSNCTERDDIIAIVNLSVADYGY